jgi:hypothetical protein
LLGAGLWRRGAVGNAPDAMMDPMDITTLAGIVFGVRRAASSCSSSRWRWARRGRVRDGRHFPGRYPPAMRLVRWSRPSIGGLAVGPAAGIVLPGLATDLPWLVWVAVAFSAIAVALNSISRSAGERRIWVPVSLVMLVSSLLVALTAP